jgi:hypothetical protein
MAGHQTDFFENWCWEGSEGRLRAPRPSAGMSGDGDGQLPLSNNGFGGYQPGDGELSPRISLTDPPSVSNASRRGVSGYLEESP